MAPLQSDNACVAPKVRLSEGLLVFVPSFYTALSGEQGRTGEPPGGGRSAAA